MMNKAICKQLGAMAIIVVISAATAELVSHSWHPSVGVYVAVLAFVSVSVPWIRAERAGREEKIIWSLVMLALVVLELNSIQKDRMERDHEQADARKMQLEQFGKIAEGIGQNVHENQQHFQATMDQALGGHGFPYFSPVLPPRGTRSAPVFPVKVFYITKEKLPLLDVNVEVRLVPRRGERGERYIIMPEFTSQGTEEDRIFHARVYQLGTIFPGVYETPIELPANQRYLLVISTRRNAFYEEIRLEPDGNEPVGQKSRRASTS